MLRSTPTADISSRAISHLSATRQHPPTSWTSSTRALAPSGLTCLLCCWPHPFVWYRRGRGALLHCLPAPAPGFAQQSHMVLHRSSPSLASAWPWLRRVGGRGTGRGWGSRGRMVRWGQDGGMGQYSRLWTGRQDVKRTQEVGWSPKVNQWLAKPDRRQGWGAVLTGRSLGPSWGCSSRFSQPALPRES